MSSIYDDLAEMKEDDHHVEISTPIAAAGDAAPADKTKEKEPKPTPPKSMKKDQCEAEIPVIKAEIAKIKADMAVNGSDEMKMLKPARFYSKIKLAYNLVNREPKKTKENNDEDPDDIELDINHYDNDQIGLSEEDFKKSEKYKKAEAYHKMKVREYNDAMKEWKVKAPNAYKLYKLENRLNALMQRLTDIANGKPDPKPKKNGKRAALESEEEDEEVPKNKKKAKTSKKKDDEAADDSKEVGDNDIIDIAGYICQQYAKKVNDSVINLVNGISKVNPEDLDDRVSKCFSTKKFKAELIELLSPLTKPEERGKKKYEEYMRRKNHHDDDDEESI